MVGVFSNRWTKDGDVGRAAAGGVVKKFSNRGIGRTGVVGVFSNRWKEGGDVGRSAAGGVIKRFSNRGIERTGVVGVFSIAPLATELAAA